MADGHFCRWALFGIATIPMAIHAQEAVPVILFDTAHWRIESADETNVQLHMTCEQALAGCVHFRLQGEREINHGERAEIAALTQDGAGLAFHYSWDFRIDDGYEDASFEQWQIIAQWHDQPDERVGESWDSYPAHKPVVALRYGAHEGQSVVALFYGLGHQQKQVSDFTPIVKGRWQHLDLDLFFSQAEDGYLQARLNDVYITQPQGEDHRVHGVNMYNAAPVYLKLGIYRARELQGLARLSVRNLVRTQTTTAITSDKESSP